MQTLILVARKLLLDHCRQQLCRWNISVNLCFIVCIQGSVFFNDYRCSAVADEWISSLWNVILQRYPLPLGVSVMPQTVLYVYHHTASLLIVPHCLSNVSLIVMQTNTTLRLRAGVTHYTTLWRRAWVTHNATLRLCAWVTKYTTLGLCLIHFTSV